MQCPYLSPHPFWGTFSTKTAECVAEARQIGPARLGLRLGPGSGERHPPFSAVITRVARTAAPLHVRHRLIGYFVARAHKAPVPARWKNKKQLVLASRGTTGPGLEAEEAAASWLKQRLPGWENTWEPPPMGAA